MSRDRLSRHRLTLVAALGAGLLAVGALTGCATGASSSPEAAPSTATSSPDSGASASPAELGAAWLDAGRAIAVVTRGSSTCVPVVSGEPSASADTLTVTLEESARTDCTRDMAPRATLVGVPAGVDPTRPLEVTVQGAAEGRTTLAALTTAPSDAGQFAPSAGWVDARTIALVTYGSSGCPPTVESVTTTGTEIAVQFAAPPADQVCTMDLAPRITLADVGDGAPAGAASVVLSGDGVDATDPIPVLGSR
ncbi:hypothetical protein AB0O16_01775 [Microbacterium sp. NPDC089180]|uniref:hypothetical protein n=1 Tax=unclassified Microbacterium TaxID=2609290 RepID=UPI00341BD107